VSSLLRQRLHAATHQGHRCFYCGLPMWLDDPQSFAAKHGLSLRQAIHLQCTAEHLQARSEGGDNRRQNIVAACRYCNSHRHKARQPLAPRELRARVAKAMHCGCWIAGILPGAFVRESIGGSGLPNKRINPTRQARRRCAG